MRFLLYFTVIVFSSCGVNEVKRPVLLVSSPILEMGVINFDSTYKIQYTLVNSGNALLVIDTITSSCGCTIPEITKKVIHPKDSAILQVSYKPVDTGYFDKKLVIRSNIDSFFSVLKFRGTIIN